MFSKSLLGVFFLFLYCAMILSSRPTAESLVLVSSSSEKVIKPTAQTAIIYSHMSIKAQNERRSGSGDGRARARKSRQKGILDQLALKCPFFPQKSLCKHTVMKSKLSHLRAKAKVLCFASAYKYSWEEIWLDLVVWGEWLLWNERWLSEEENDDCFHMSQCYDVYQNH